MEEANETEVKNDTDRRVRFQDDLELAPVPEEHNEQDVTAEIGKDNVNDDNINEDDIINDVQPPSAINQPPVTRSGRMSRPPTHDSEEGYQFVGIGGENRSVVGFLCAQTTYINFLKSYNEVNLVAQHAVEHLSLTKLGMKAAIKRWGDNGVKAIIKKMEQFHDTNVVRPL